MLTIVALNLHVHASYVSEETVLVLSNEEKEE